MLTLTRFLERRKKVRFNNGLLYIYDERMVLIYCCFDDSFFSVIISLENN